MKSKRKNISKNKDAKKNQSLKPWQPVKMKLFQIDNFMKDVPTKEERIQIIRTIGSKAKEEFINKYPKIIKWFENYDSLYILSFCLYYFMTHEEGIDPEIQGEDLFYPHYLEILQAFALMRERTIDAKPLLDNVYELKKDMQKIGELMMLRTLEIPNNISTDEELEAYKLRMDMITHTTAIRNWAYYSQMKKVILDLAETIKANFLELYRIDLPDFINMLFSLSEEKTEQINEHRRKIRSFVIKTTYQEVFKAYHEAFPNVQNMNHNEMDIMWNRAGKDLNSLKSFFIMHSDLGLTQLFSFTIKHAQSLMKSNPNHEDLEDLFKRFTHNFKDLKDFNPDHIILSNPIQRKPFIYEDKETLFTTMWVTMTHNMLNMIEDLFLDDIKIREKYNTKKANYLEEETEKMFKKAFPSAQIFKGSLWKDINNNKLYENDLIVVIDTFAIVVEAKSGGVTDSAKRGAPDRLFETLKKLIEEPSEQALRFIDFLKENQFEHYLKTKKSTINTIDSSKIKYYIPIGVTFSHLGTIASNLKKLTSAGIVNKTIQQLALSISFTDLQSIFDILELESEKIHYLARRKEMEENLQYEGDELDLLAFYLDNGFNITENEYADKMAYQLLNKSKELDPYLIGKDLGKKVVKPSLSKSRWWKDILKSLSIRKPSGWIETSFILLNSTKENQEDLEKQIKDLIIKIRNNKTELPHNWIYYSSGTERRFMIAVYPYTIQNKILRNEIMETIIQHKETEKAKGVVVIGININQNDYPYSVMARRSSTELFI
ncbi:MAG TPA: hypothetical protein PK431_03070 [Chitinophagales bacterium]|jgi:hypothetical protein|nr:hypothetical protein [Chitinophagales bacterium]